jgi:bifunctional ADP-heptose synthase (sugar kinase/adenylyltransferase)
MKVLVIGDSCKDVFVYGKCDRLSPAAPVPVFVPVSHKENKGMAGNVWQNLVSFETLEVDLITNETEVTKTRYVHESTNHMFVRVDSGEEKIERISNLDLINFDQYDAVIISDYNKGFLREADITKIGERHPLTFLDTKKLLGPWAESITFIKINQQEYDRTAHTLFNYDRLTGKLIVTLGSRGCRYRQRHFPVDKVEIKDPIGAGDSFLAALVFRYLHNNGLMQDAIEFANDCASLVVQQKGVNTVR